MAPVLIDTAVYACEGLVPDLESPPIAARRALDQAGLRLSIEGWRSLPLEDRRKVTVSGMHEQIDGALIDLLLRRASPSPQRTLPVADPDPGAPPEPLARALEPDRTLDVRRWQRLRAVDRYALSYGYRRALARGDFGILGEIYDCIAAMSIPPPPLTGPPPSSRPPGYYSRGEPAADPRVEEPFAVSPTQRPPPPSNRPPPSTRSPVSLLGEGRATPIERPRGLDRPTPLPPSTAARAPTIRKLSEPFEPRFTPSGRAAPTPIERPRVAPIERVDPPSSFPVRPTPPSNHVNDAGEVHMVGVGHKPATFRQAVASGEVRMAPETLDRLLSGDTPKGEVLATARIAAIMAAKKTPELIPLCHGIALTKIEVDIQIDEADSVVVFTVVAEAFDRTGVEMEAMVAVSAGCLTLYDMLKGIDREMVVSEIKLLEKTGGKTGRWVRGEGT